MQNKDNYNIRIIVATILSTVLMFAWIKFYGKKTIPSEPVKVAQEQVVETKSVESEIKKIAEIKNNVVENATEEKLLKIETSRLTGSINLRGLVFDNLVLNDYKDKIDSDEKVHLLSPRNMNNSYFIEFGWDSDDTSLDLPNQNTLWNADNDVLSVNNPVTLSYRNKQGVLFQVVLSVDSEYMFTINQSVINGSENTALVKISNRISRKTTDSTEMAIAVHEGFIGSFGKEVEEIKYKKLKGKNFIFDAGLSWAGFTDKYWLVSMAPENNKSSLFGVGAGYKNGDYNVDFVSGNIIVNSNQKNEVTTTLFAGPKILTLLDQYAFQYDLVLFDRAVDFGWFYFLTKPIYIVLKTLYNFFGNFGLAIIVLTLIVKSIMYPFTKKSYISIAKMKEAQPKIDALKERFKDDKMRMNRELVELYKRENISPLSGCLPMLVQIPVFFSLYKVLVISIDMRQAPFFGYIRNLAEKDPTTIWNLFGLLPYNVSFLHIGLLPCLMSLTMWVQQKMSSAGTTNPETQMVTKLMPIIFLLMFAGMPAGLLIYWTFSNIITIAQQYYVEKRLLRNKNKNNVTVMRKGK